jgi:hypothetical protein
LKSFKEFISESRSAKPKVPQDPPAVLLMKRKAIRMFPNGQRVALYYVDKINKYVTVPYEAMHWSSSVPNEFKNITLG